MREVKLPPSTSFMPSIAVSSGLALGGMSAAAKITDWTESGLSMR